MHKLLKKIIGDKKAWKAMEARADRLPHDYRVVYNEMKNYMWNLWRFSTSSGNQDQSMATLEDLLSLFENGARSGKNVLEVTGKDVAGFCDDLFQATASWRAKLNAEIMRKLEQ